MRLQERAQSALLAVRQRRQAAAGRARLALALRALLRPANALRLLLLRPAPPARAPDSQPDGGLMLALVPAAHATGGGSRLHDLLRCQAFGERRRGRRADTRQACRLASKFARQHGGCRAGAAAGARWRGRAGGSAQGLCVPALGGLAPLALARGLLLSLVLRALLRGPGGRARARRATLRAPRVGAATRARQLMRPASRLGAWPGGTAARLGLPARAMPQPDLPAAMHGWDLACCHGEGSQADSVPGQARCMQEAKTSTRLHHMCSWTAQVQAGAHVQRRGLAASAVQGQSMRTGSR